MRTPTMEGAAVIAAGSFGSNNEPNVLIDACTGNFSIPLTTRRRASFPRRCLPRTPSGRQHSQESQRIHPSTSVAKALDFALRAKEPRVLHTGAGAALGGGAHTWGGGQRWFRDLCTRATPARLAHDPWEPGPVEIPVLVPEWGVCERSSRPGRGGPAGTRPDEAAQARAGHCDPNRL